VQRAGTHGAEAATNAGPAASALGGSLTSEASLAETAAAAAVLRAAGWRVITVDASTPLAVAWQQLPRSGSSLLAASDREFGAAR
jgi:hypothetical protein